jgi:hypothetical protein
MPKTRKPTTTLGASAEIFRYGRQFTSRRWPFVEENAPPTSERSSPPTFRLQSMAEHGNHWRTEHDRTLPFLSPDFSSFRLR